MEKATPQCFLEDLIARYPKLLNSKEDIARAFSLLCQGYKNQKKLLLCGNGGSAADCEHIVGELMKGFLSERPLKIKPSCEATAPGEKQEPLWLTQLQGALPAVSLCGHPALRTAIENDIGKDCDFAQQVIGLGQAGDMLLGISTSGNSENVCRAMEAAGLKGMKRIGLTGRSGGKMLDLCDVCICVDETETYRVQELHLPVYHCLCAMLEYAFFEEEDV